MIERTPYARMLGVRTLPAAPGTVALVMPATPQLEGRAGFLYGGVIASLLELACLEAIAQTLGGDGGWPKPMNISVDFLRGGLMVDSHARAPQPRWPAGGERGCRLLAGRSEKPIATGRMHPLLD